MRLVPETLPRELARGLKPAWLVLGEEPLLIGECADLIRASAAQGGFAAREVHFVGRGYDWASLEGEVRSPSLFAERRVIELKLAGSKPGADGSRTLANLATGLPEDVLLLVLGGPIEWSERSSAWVRAFESSAAFVDVARVTPEQLPGWVAERLKRAQVSADAEAAQLIADRCEGNLLAAHQQIERLALDAGSSHLTAEAAAELIAESARYDVSALGEAVLGGDPKRALKILEGLEAEGEEPTLVLWSLTEELRSVLQWRGPPGGDAPRRLWRGGRRRQALIAQAARRLPRAQALKLLTLAQRADLTIKGLSTGRAWDDLARLAVRAAGATLPGARP